MKPFITGVIRNGCVTTQKPHKRINNVDRLEKAFKMLEVKEKEPEGGAIQFVPEIKKKKVKYITTKF
jgi:hypothetical protein